ITRGTVWSSPPTMESVWPAVGSGASCILSLVTASDDPWFMVWSFPCLARRRQARGARSPRLPSTVRLPADYVSTGRPSGGPAWGDLHGGTCMGGFGVVAAACPSGPTVLIAV